MGVLKDMMSDIVRELLPHKTFEQRIEEQNTRTVWYPRVHGFSRKYVYGKVPGKPLVTTERHPEGVRVPAVQSSDNPAVIREHIAICSREPGSRGGLCEMCRKLNNPQRRAFLVRLYKDGRPIDQAGFNVGDAVDKSELSQPATSQYLRQLSELGLVRRERCGRIVSYVPEICGAPYYIRDVAEMMRKRWRDDPTDESFVPIFRVMMGPFRARVVRFLAAGGCRSVEGLADRFSCRTAELIRQLEWAVEGGVLDLTSEDADGEYLYLTPSDPIARRIVELS